MRESLQIAKLIAGCLNLLAGIVMALVFFSVPYNTGYNLRITSLSVVLGFLSNGIYLIVSFMHEEYNGSTN